MKDQLIDSDFLQKQNELFEKDRQYRLKRAIDNANKKEKYYSQVIQPRMLSFESIASTLCSEETSVEKVIERNELHKALHKALESLNEEEKSLINDNFFYSDSKRTQQVLAQELGITRQAYDKRLKQVLKKLKILVEKYINLD